MQLHRNGTSPLNEAPERGSTGDVLIGGYFERASPSRLAGAPVSFAPGARTPWTVNPIGQTLIVLSGVGWVQCEGSAIVEVRAGDVIGHPPGQRHWEGATPEDPMTDVAIHEVEEGRGVEFGEAVTDEDYRSGPHAA